MADFGQFNERDFLSKGYDSMAKEQGDTVSGRLAGPVQYANGPSISTEQPTLTHRLNVLEKQFYEFQQHTIQRVERLEQMVDMLCRYVGK